MKIQFLENGKINETKVEKSIQAMLNHPRFSNMTYEGASKIIRGIAENELREYEAKKAREERESKMSGAELASELGLIF